MASRIFVTGLPPSLTPHEFKKHFSSQGSITDTKLFPERRIGYVGYKTPQEAEKAVKFFNRTFIRMSKLGVEIARPIASKEQERRADYQAAVQVQPTQTEKNLKRKRGADARTEDPKLKEYLEVMQKKPATKDQQPGTVSENLDVVLPAKDDSDDDVQVIPRTKKPRERHDSSTQQLDTLSKVEDSDHVDSTSNAAIPEGEVVQTVTNTVPTATDEDWLRSRTNRLLDLQPEDEVMTNDGPMSEDRRNRLREDKSAKQDQPEDFESEPVIESYQEQQNNAIVSEPTADLAIPTGGNETEMKIRESGRLYIRNLAYTTSEEDLQDSFGAYGAVAEVHVAIDKKTSQSKGFAFVQFENADDAATAWKSLDGTPLNGRLLHILPGSAKRENKIDDFSLSKLSHKKQEQIKRRQEAATKTFNWNSLYMNTDAVLSSVADRLGADKSSLLDPTSSDAAVKQAHAETHVIQETKSYFKSHGVNLDSFSRKKRGDTAILVKNFPYDAKASELKDLFEQHGKLKRFLLPPSGTIAIVEFENSAQAKSAFKALAYSRIKSSMLYLEFAPQDLFQGGPVEDHAPVAINGTSAQPIASDLLQTEDIPDNLPTATLFVRNLNFNTTTQRLDEVFRPLDGFLSALVKTKTDPKKPGQLLSMGFGFLEFRTKTQAQKALFAMDGYKLDGHSLQIRASHKGQDAAEERKQSDKAKKQASKRAKLVIKNLPFEATKKDVRSLFGAYGQLRSVRVPKKIGQSTRGFAFAEFTTPKEAENARDALQNTHLLGRRLVIDYAAEDPEDAEEEIEKMQSKVGSQLNKVAVQKLMGDGSRSKFRVNDQGAEDE
ncbi:RNA recognition motif-containing protein 14 [Elsinoe australis]|uniref:Multiple RNA-binding domain-containing protein 1 n=1 Tax=Elsinoe australis TaxID=40998 RepID=A0A4V6DU14_9PEZI|nr:RNA recognition motif-containing protein 14 [Elsinoe australis]